MINLVVAEKPAVNPPPVRLKDYPVVTFYVTPGSSQPCAADWCAISLTDPIPGRSEVSIMFGGEKSPQDIENLRSLIEGRINELQGELYLVEITEIVTRGLDEQGVIAHASYVPD